MHPFLFNVTLITLGSGIDVVKMRISNASTCHFIQTNGYGTITYTALVHGLESVDVVVAYYHHRLDNDEEPDAETMGISTVVYFNPNGSVKLKEVLLQLDRQPVRLHFPLDIIEEKFVRAKEVLSNGDIFHGLDMADLYGKQVTFSEKDSEKVRRAVFERNHGIRRHRPPDSSIDAGEPNGHFKVPRLEDMASFMEHKRIAEKKDAAIAVELKRHWLLPLKRMLRSMFNDRQRARDLLRMWHSSSPPRPTPVVPDSPTLYANFMRNLLSCRLELIVSDSYISVFNHQTFIIPLGNLKREEQVIRYLPPLNDLLNPSLISSLGFL
jgi:hypothetical protein